MKTIMLTHAAINPPLPITKLKFQNNFLLQSSLSSLSSRSNFNFCYFSSKNLKCKASYNNKDDQIRIVTSESSSSPSTPTLPMPWELQEEGEEEAEDIPYIPEVDEEASVPDQVLSEIASGGATTVQIKNVTKIFKVHGSGFKYASDDVSFTVEPGQMVALVGPSGSGKTTLLRMIAGLEKPTSGTILFDSQDVTDVTVQDRNIGFMFQSYALFKHKTVAENIAYGLTTAKRKGIISQETVKKRVNDLLELVQLTNFGDRYPPQLSGGQRQRVALARALATQPRVLLLDEPFGALDVLVRSDLRLWVKKLQKKLSITTIFVTHDQEEALEMADSMIVFHKGKIAQIGNPFDILTRPASPFVMNFINEPLTLRSTSYVVRRSGLRTSKPYVMFRQDDVYFYKKENLSLPTTPATVEEVNNFGPQVAIEIAFDDGEKIEFIKQRYDFEERPFEIGERVHVHLLPLSLMPFDLDEIKP